MLNRLHEALRQLPMLLDAPDWESLDIDYHAPRVERLFRPFGDGRLYLHRIHPCAEGEALFHPHPWPCAIRVLSGRYEMGVGAGTTDPVIASRLISRGSLDYEMTDPDAWHYVRPLGEPALSVMVTGAPWDRPSPRPEYELKTLARASRDALRKDIGVALQPREKRLPVSLSPSPKIKFE